MNDIITKVKRFYFLLFFSSFLISCSTSKEFSEYENVEGNFIESGIASWYGPDFHGNKTANGERFNTNELTAAHRTLPFNSIVRVINSENGKSVMVRINDRGPFTKNRIIDLSKKAAEEIEMIENGTSSVKLFLLNNINLPNDLKEAHFTVQVASFKSLNDAKKYAGNISNSRVVKADVNGDTYYRVYVGNFTSKIDANNLLEKLKQNGIKGFVKQVEN